MLLQNMIPTPVETALPFSSCSSHGKEDLLCDWAPTKCHTICSQPGECSNGSSIPLESIGTHKRRRLQENPLLVTSVQREADKATSETLAINSIKPDQNCATDDFVQANAISVESLQKDASSIDEPAYPQSLSESFDKNSSFSSLKVERVVGSAARVEAGNMKEFSTPNSATLGADASARDVCISFLRSSGLLVSDCSVIGAPSKTFGDGKDTDVFQYCDLCGVLDNTLNMLLCDNCEGAFHVSCCNSKTKIKIKELPLDEWFCQFCINLDDKVSLEAAFMKSNKISWSNGLSKFKSGAISYMLTCSEQHTSRVRIGDSFQAVIPQWSDQNSKDVDCIGEPLEMNPIETLGLHGSSKDRYLQPASLNNWLQCREVLRGAGESAEGTICGKWRRAPLSEVQTDYWDCSCAVVWDPFHSDCAVPQELETCEVLQQLKYINQLRLRASSRV